MLHTLSASFLLICFLQFIEDTISEANVSKVTCSPGIKKTITLEDHFYSIEEQAKDRGNGVINIFFPIKKNEILEISAKGKSNNQSQSEITSENIENKTNISPNYKVEIRGKPVYRSTSNNGKRKYIPNLPDLGEFGVSKPAENDKFNVIGNDKEVSFNNLKFSMTSKWLNPSITGHKNKRSVNIKNTDEQENINYFQDSSKKADDNSNEDNEGRMKNKARQNSRYSGYRGYRYRGYRYGYGSSAGNSNRPTITIHATINFNNDVTDVVNANNVQNISQGNNFKPQPNARCNPSNHLFYQNPEDCSTYFTCNQGIMVLTHCPRGLYYMPERFRCEDGLPVGCKVFQYHASPNKPINEN